MEDGEGRNAATDGSEIAVDVNIWMEFGSNSFDNHSR